MKGRQGGLPGAQPVPATVGAIHCLIIHLISISNIIDRGLWVIITLRTVLV